MHNKKYDYSKVVWDKGNRQRVIIICPKHGEFTQTVKNHLRGKGCTNIECKQQKQKETSKANYGVEYAAQSKIVQDKMKQTCQERYGVENVFASDEFKKRIKETIASKDDEWKQKLQEKRRETCIEKYGTEHPIQNIEVKAKIRQTCLEKYGVDYSLQVKDVRDKGKATNLQRYGAENPFASEQIKEKIKKQNMQLYGVENTSQRLDVMAKKIQTSQERYGVNNVSQVPEIAAKSFISRYKNFTFPSGKIVKYQGYEHLALQDLLKYGVEESNILTGIEVPRIPYEFENVNRVYFPDIYIPTENKIIEVKSEYTLQRDEAKNLAKRDATIAAGYDFEFWVYDRRHNKVNDINSLLTVK